jgi:hypothetical protein
MVVFVDKADLPEMAGITAGMRLARAWLWSRV